MKKNKIKYGKKSNEKAHTILVCVTAVTCIITSLLAGSLIYTHISISQDLEVVKILSEELDEAEAVMDKMIEQEEQYKKAIDAVNNQIAQYKPIVIPESMQAQ